MLLNIQVEKQIGWGEKKSEIRQISTDKSSQFKKKTLINTFTKKINISSKAMMLEPKRSHWVPWTCAWASPACQGWQQWRPKPPIPVESEECLIIGPIIFHLDLASETGYKL